MIRKLFVVTSLILLNQSSFAGSRVPEVTLDHGAKVFYDRCTLCHGNDGMGEGILPLSIKDYPPTNLFSPKYGEDRKSIRKAIVFGGSKKEMSEEMPPWGDELTYRDLESVAMFVEYLRGNSENAIVMLSKEALTGSPGVRKGRGVYITRCTLCHGKFGEGDGRMARVIKDPPPFNLTLSRVPDDYLRNIINKGGSKLGRSARMPPWEDDLTPVEVDSLVLYLKTLRVN